MIAPAEMGADRLRYWREHVEADSPLIAIACLAAFALRVVPFLTRVIAPDWVLPAGDADVLYHLRRIALAARAWPRVPAFDAWMDHPHGTYSPWPPLFDAIPATFARATGIDPLHVGVFWPPLLGALSVAPFYALVRGLFGRAPARLATALFVVLPANVAISALGRVDHHVAEVLLQLCVYAWLLRSLHALERGQALCGRESVGFGLLLAACFLTWAASMLFLWVALAVTCAWLLPPRAPEQARAGARHIAIAFSVAALACAPWAIEPLLRGGPAFEHYELSLITPLLCLESAAAIAGAAWCAAALQRGVTRQALARGAAVAVALLLPCVVPAMRESLMSGVGLVGRARNPWLAEISEFAPLLSSPHTRRFAEQHVGYAHLLLPPLVTWLALRCARARTAAHWLALGWALNATLLAFAQSRFLFYAAPLVAATPAAAAQLVAGRARWLAPLGAAACLAAAAPALWFYWQPLLRTGGLVPMQNLDMSQLAFLGQVAAATPPAGDSGDAGRRATYGVFAPWDLGHALIYFAHRAVVANNHGDEYEGADGFADERRAFRIETDEAALVALLRKRDCPYLITSAGAVLFTARAPAPRPVTTRLHIGNGSDLEHEPGSGRFRLLAQGPRRDASGLAEYKLFERVQGAELVLDDMRESELRVATRVELGTLSFAYVRQVAAPAGGTSGRVRLSYPGEYRILSRDRVLGTFEVTLRAITAGETFHMHHDAAAP